MGDDVVRGSIVLNKVNKIVLELPDFLYFDLTVAFDSIPTKDTNCTLKKFDKSGLKYKDV